MKNFLQKNFQNEIDSIGDLNKVNIKLIDDENLDYKEIFFESSNVVKKIAQKTPKKTKKVKKKTMLVKKKKVKISKEKKEKVKTSIGDINPSIKEIKNKKTGWWQK